MIRGSGPGSSRPWGRGPELADDAYPIRVRIPDIGVDAEVIDLGLNPDGTLEVPEDYDQTGYYTGWSVPGNVGPSVVVGHIDSYTGPAVFFRLGDLEVGSVVEVHRSDGLVALFRVSEMTLVEKTGTPPIRCTVPRSNRLCASLPVDATWAGRRSHTRAI